MKYLLKETSSGETDEVETWLNAGEANLEQFNQLREIWQQSKMVQATLPIDEEAAWQRFRQRTFNSPSKQNKSFTLPSWIRIAAVLLLIAGVGMLSYNLITGSRRVELIALESGKASRQQILGDGSAITLNKNSSIRYPEEFEGNTREVKLEGEAFFSVAPDRTKPFIIEVNDVKVQVVGTSFNVRGTNGETEIIVETGIVRVIKNGKTVELKANEKLLVRSNDQELKKETEKDQLYNYYRTREFVCDNTPLWKLVDVLNEAYQTNIFIANKEHRSLALTTTFSDESLDHILEIISITFNIKVERQPDGRIALK